jgi:hypothetical protein
VVSADDAEANDVMLFVEDHEALGAARGGEAGDDVDLAEGAHGPNGDKAAHHGPDGDDRRGYLLHDRT